ncbi:MAG: sugar-binding protein [Phycisphaerae bacterium]
MKVAARLAGTALVAVIVMAAVGADEPKKDAPKGPPELKLTVAKEAPPKVDGVLDDEIWKNAAVFTDFKLPDGTAPKGKAKLLVAQDDKALYIAAECFENEKGLKNLVANAKDHDEDGIWNDDDVELFLDPTGKRNDYYQIIVNSKGVTWDGYCADPGRADTDWNPKYQCAAKVGKESWVVELAIPWAAFNQTRKFSDTWAFNCLHMRQGGGEEEMQFAPVEGSAHQPDKFGKLVGVIGKAGGATSGPATASAPAKGK